MKVLVFIPPNEFRDESLDMTKMFFERWNVAHDISSYSKKECIGSHGASCKPDINTNMVVSVNYDGIMLLDGKGIDTYKLYDFRPLLDLITQFNNGNKLVCAVGNAIRIIARANIIKGRRIVVPEDEETKRTVILFHGVPSNEGSESSENIITIKGYGDIEGAMPTILEKIGVK